MPTDLRAHAEALIAAIDAADCGHSMRLTRLVDEVSTYTAVVGDQTAEFPGTDEVYEWIREVKGKRKADAILTALAALHDEAARAALVAAQDALKENEGRRMSKVGGIMSGGGRDYDIGRATGYAHALTAIRAIDPASLREGV